MRDTSWVPKFIKEDEACQCAGELWIVIVFEYESIEWCGQRYTGCYRTMRLDTTPSTVED